MKFRLLNKIYDISQIQSISDILEPSTEEFDDSECSTDNEIDWMTRFVVIFNNGKSITITKYDTKSNLKELHSKLTDFWLNPIKYIPEFN